MPTRMTHPRHGVTHAYGAEIDHNIKNGWKIEEKAKVVIEATPDPVPDEQIPPVAFKRGPGRPRKVR